MSNRIKSSARELKNTRSLVTCAVLIALYVIADVFLTFKTDAFEITTSFLALALIGYFFGPVPGFISAIVGDLVAYIFRPAGPFYPGFTLSAILICVIFAFFFYEKKVTLWRIILARSIINIFVNIGLGTLWISHLYGKAYIPLLISRAAKNIIALPFEILLLYLLLKNIEKIMKHTGGKSRI